MALEEEGGTEIEIKEITKDEIKEITKDEIKEVAKDEIKEVAKDEIKEITKEEITTKEPKKKSINNVLKELAGATDGLLVLGVMDMEGVPIAVVTPPGSSLNAELAAAQLAVVVRLCSLTADKLKLGEFDENLISTASKYILTRPLGANFYLAMVLSKDSTTLGMVRMVAKEHADQIYEVLPKF